MLNTLHNGEIKEEKQGELNGVTQPYELALTEAANICNQISYKNLHIIFSFPSSSRLDIELIHQIQQSL